MQPSDSPEQNGDSPQSAPDKPPGAQPPQPNQPEPPQPNGPQPDRQNKQPDSPGQGQGESQPPGEGQEPGQSSGKGDSPSQQPSEQAGEGQPGQGQTPGQGSESPNKTGAGGQPGEQGGPQQPGHARGGQGSGEQGTPAQPGSEHGQGTSSQKHDQFSLEDRKKAAELVLNQLEEDLKRGDVDENLLKDLGWEKDNLKQFQQRMADYLRRQQQGNENDLKQKQFDEMLKNIRLGGDRGARTGNQSGRSNTDEFAPTLTPAPPEYRELEQAFRRSLLEQQP